MIWWQKLDGLFQILVKISDWKRLKQPFFQTYVSLKRNNFESTLKNSKFADCWAEYQSEGHLFVSDSMLCVYSESNCIDNIGGLLLKDKLLYGILSREDGGWCSYDGLRKFTELKHFYSWIQSKIN